ncbi:MAG: acetate kinase, partial [Clostridia bacterium]|nr:acetate kinase [Clostridia bacterium]
IDPAVVPFIMEKEGFTPAQMSDFMNKKCGFLGVSGISSDCRDIEAAIAEGNERAKLALDILIYQIKKYIGAYTAAMGGLDAIVFTAGIGENTASLRQQAMEGMEYFGIEIDQAVNAVARGTLTKLSTDASKVQVYLIPTNEELVIASDTENIVKGLAK